MATEYITAKFDPKPRNQNNRLIRCKLVEAKTGHGTSSIYAQIAEGTFPRPVKIGKRAVAWRESEIDDWIDSRQKTEPAQETTKQLDGEFHTEKALRDKQDQSSCKSVRGVRS